jgi:hypothetical protein
MRPGLAYREPNCQIPCGVQRGRSGRQCDIGFSTYYVVYSVYHATVAELWTEIEILDPNCSNHTLYMNMGPLGLLVELIGRFRFRYRFRVVQIQGGQGEYRRLSWAHLTAVQSRAAKKIFMNLNLTLYSIQYMNLKPAPLVQNSALPTSQVYMVEA